MMMMYFHGGYNETILFEFWKISTLGGKVSWVGSQENDVFSSPGLIASMIGCFLLGILYEGLKFLREFLINSELRRSTYTNVGPTPVEVPDDEVHGHGHGNDRHDTISADGDSPRRSASPVRRSNQVKVLQTSLLSRGHLIQTCLQFVQVEQAQKCSDPPKRDGNHRCNH